tara:strand:+ start:1888 stop:2166 length:279 start_codon:yes stop_codon:yes gene_type:complete
MNDITKLAERIATAIESITEVQTITSDRIIEIAESLSDVAGIVSEITSEIEQVQLDMQKVNEGNVLTCIEELQQTVADLKQEPVGMLFTPVV